MSLDEAYYPSERRRFVKKAGNRTPERARCKTCSNAADKTVKGIPYCEGCAPVEVPVFFGQTVH